MTNTVSAPVFNAVDTALLRRIAATAAAMAAAKLPACWIDEDFVEHGHWSSLEGLLREEVLKRRLSDAEITCLSLSRNFGPTPALPDELTAKISRKLFPKGNNTGGWFGWQELADAIGRMADPKSFQEEFRYPCASEYVHAIAHAIASEDTKVKKLEAALKEFAEMMTGAMFACDGRQQDEMKGERSKAFHQAYLRAKEAAKAALEEVLSRLDAGEEFGRYNGGAAREVWKITRNRLSSTKAC